MGLAMNEVIGCGVTATQPEGRYIPQEAQLASYLGPVITAVAVESFMSATGKPAPGGNVNV